MREGESEEYCAGDIHANLTPESLAGTYERDHLQYSGQPDERLRVSSAGGTVFLRSQYLSS